MKKPLNPIPIPQNKFFHPGHNQPINHSPPSHGGTISQITLNRSETSTKIKTTKIPTISYQRVKILR
jgi:hypothetical protein